MGFPPVFSQVWDITFPPDTQLANLLGQDIRDLKNEVMQRMSLMSGILANRPTPETVNATWGGSGYGILYFSTDTNQIFQWNGVNWVPITVTGSKFTDTTSVTVVNPTTGVFAGNGVILPANTLQPGSSVQVFARMTAPQATLSNSFINPLLSFGGDLLNNATTPGLNLSGRPAGSVVMEANFTVVSAAQEAGWARFSYESNGAGASEIGVPIFFNGSFVAANATAIGTGLEVVGATGVTYDFDYLLVIVNT